MHNPSKGGSGTPQRVYNLQCYKDDLHAWASLDLLQAKGPGNSTQSHLRNASRDAAEPAIPNGVG